MLLRTLASIFAVALALPAQNLVPDGEFHDGGGAWTMVSFNDPLGTTGFASARVAGRNCPPLPSNISAVSRS